MHSISKAMVNGQWVYTLWELPRKILGNFNSAEDAKAALNCRVIGGDCV